MRAVSRRAAGPSLAPVGRAAAPPGERGKTVLGVQVCFFVPAETAPVWVEAVLQNLKGKGFRFPNLRAGQVSACRWEEVPAARRPGFAAEQDQWDEFCGGRDLRIFVLYLDADFGAAEFNVVMRSQLTRRYSDLCELVPGIPVEGPWVALVADATVEPLYATQKTVNVRRGDWG